MAISTQKFIEQLSSINLLNAAELDTIRAKLDEKQLQADAERLAKELVKARKLTRYQAAALYQGRGKGLVCGEYVVLDKIGAGGMGQVFKAQHRRMKRLAALKILPPHLMKDPQIIKRFYQEVEMAAKLNHPHIVQAYDAAESHGLHFLVMEYIEGDDLASIVTKRGPLTVEQAMHCLRQVAEGLAYAHAQGIMHRDIKPANLLLDRQGNVKILDMGLARMVDALQGRDAHAVQELTQEGQVMGTVDYMAPEQARDAHSVDHRADLYSLGCTLYRLVTGEVPYPADKLVKKLLAHATEPIPSLRKLCPNVPIRLEQLYERMMAKDPAERIASAREVADTLQACLSGVSEAQSSVSVLEDSADSQDWQSYIQSAAASSTALSRVKRNDPASGKMPRDQKPAAERKSPLPIPLPYAVGGGVAVLLLLVGGWWAWRSRGSPSPVTPQVAQTPEMPQEPEAVIPPAASSEPTLPRPPPVSTDKPAATANPEPKADPPSQATTSLPLPAAKPPDDKVLLDLPATKTPATPKTPSIATHVPQTLIVGTQNDQVLDLKTALQRAGPGDTILIRHRGPLEFTAVDLTGKTPLTIKGDVADGVDFWPILRQAKRSPNTPPGDPAPGVFHGDRFELVLEKIHLAVAGLNWQPCSAIFSLKSGRVELKQCSLTVGVQSEPPKEPTLVPLVAARGGPDDRVEIALAQSHLRGGALGSCATAVDAGNVDINANDILWAGGPAPWLNLRNLRGQLTSSLTGSTIYNAAALLRWYAEPNLKVNVSRAVAFRCERSLLVGPYPGQERLIDWNPDGSAAGLAVAVAGGAIVWQGDLNVSHRYAGYYRDGTKTADLAAWKKLWHQSGVTFHRDSDPMFRVWPDGHLLEETSAWDLHPRFWRNFLKTRQRKEAIGADYQRLPVAPSVVFDRTISPPDVAQKPRGQPRILRVHQKDGPYKTLEAAFAEVQEDEIIEVADNGPYIPGRNFDVSPGQGVLVVPADYLTLRAAENAQPVVILSDTSQQGTVPSLGSSMGVQLSLIASGNRRFLEIDGWHFLVRARSNLQHCVLHAEAQKIFFRCSNCTFRMALSEPLVPGTKPADFRAHGMRGTSNQWVENNLYLAAGNSTIYIFLPDTVARMALRNCLFDDRMLGTSSAELPFLEMRGSSAFGDAWTLNNVRSLGVRAEDNFLVSTQAILNVADPGVLRGATHSGSNNALWAGTRPLTPQERDAGVNALFPGPPLKTPPVPDGPGSPRDPLQKYRLKKGQPAATMARDGGPVGVRFEYLPTLPP